MSNAGTPGERVLVLMSSAKDAQRTLAVLAAAGLEGVACTDGPHFCSELIAGAGAVLLSEEVILADREHQIQKALLAQPAWSTIPLVAVVREGAAVARRDSLLSDLAANVTLVERPLRMQTLVSVVRGALRARRHQYEARDALAERELALDAARLGWWRYDPASGIVAHDERFGEIYGLGGRSHSAEEIRALLHPDDFRRTRAAIEAALNPLEPKSYAVEYQINRPDGSMRWLEVRGLATFEGEGSSRKATSFVGTVADVTDRKQAAEQLKRNHDTFYHLIQNNPFGIYVIDADFRLREVSKGAQNVFKNVRPLLGRDFADVLRTIWEEPFASEAIGRFRHCLETGEPFAAPTTAKRNDINASESYDWQIERIILPDGRYGVVCYFYDLTDLHRAETALRDADRRKDEFLATLAHELRNPLAPIRNGIGVLRLSNLSGDAGEVLSVIERQLAQLVGLVDDLLDVARVTSGKIVLRSRSLDLRDAVEAAIETSRPSVECGNHALDVRLPDEPLPVTGDPSRLAQVVTNILNNACKYTPEGGRIQLIAERDESHAVVRIIDNGIGIPTEMLPKVFDTFTQVGRSLDRSQGGLGLGLALARSLVEKHGGAVSAESPGPGGGATFTIRIPIAHTGPDSRSTKLAAPPSPLAVRRVLIVDDLKPAADILRMMLTRLGQETQAVYDGPTALKSLDEFRPDVVISDIGMQGMDGYELAQRVRSMFNPSPVLVALTGYGQPEDQRRALDAGFDHHLVKPSSIETLQQLLASIPSRTPVSGD